MNETLLSHSPLRAFTTPLYPTIHLWSTHFLHFDFKVQLTFHPLFST